MSRKCSVSGKGSQWGNKVSKANNKTKKISRPNLKSKRLFDEETKTWVRVKISARGLRTVDKQGGLRVS
jgi:large subunit ribosomal protein L28